MQKTQGQIEAAITAEIVKFDKEFMGRGPSGCRTHLIDDLVLVHLKGCLTPSEFQFVSVNQNNPNLNGSQTTLAQNREAIKTMRREILERGRSLLEKEINSLTGRNVISLHTDLSTKNGDRVILLLLDHAPSIVENTEAEEE